jgi:hypothetical protein
VEDTKPWIALQPRLSQICCAQFFGQLVEATPYTSFMNISTIQTAKRATSFFLHVAGRETCNNEVLSKRIYGKGTTFYKPFAITIPL